jgi:hypothetical protein
MLLTCMRGTGGRAVLTSGIYPVVLLLRQRQLAGQQWAVLLCAAGS